MRAAQMQRTEAAAALAAAGPAQRRAVSAATARQRQPPSRRGAATVTAAVQPGQDRQPRAPDAPPAGQPKPVKIELFETQGMEEPAPSGSQDNLLSLLLSSLDTSEPMSFDGEEKTEYDPLRDGPLRYLGYANELGEAFAAWLFAGGVPLSYAVAIGYVLFDTYDKWQKTLADARAKLGSRPGIPPSVDVGRLATTIGAERGLDTLVWQLIASVAAPGFTIHQVVAAANWVLARAEDTAGVAAGLRAAAAALGADPAAFLETFNKSVPTALGLLAIPFIVHPIDAAVHAALNASLRPAMRRYICQQAGGAQAGLAICQDCRPGK